MKSPMHAQMEAIYQWICLQPDQEAAIAALEDYALRDLHAWMEERAVSTGVPAMILGLVLCEGAQRFFGEDAL